MNRSTRLALLSDTQPWDVLIIGGGASGLGAAVDAAARGYRTLLVEARDFASGTSSCSTKLIHGGVRYLRQGDFSLVRNALQERAHLLKNAAHLVHPLAFVIPTGNLFDRLFYGAGLKLYDLLAGKQGLASSQILNRQEVINALPGLSEAELNGNQLNGGIRYWDGQFDDARLAISLMRTATDLGASCFNYLAVSQLTKANERIVGAILSDTETGNTYEVKARSIINATGVYADQIRQLDDPKASALLTPSQGIHIVVDAEFLPGQQALLIPETEDGRVMFAIPWQGKVIIGTTDTPRPELKQLDDPQPLAEEINFLLRTAARCLCKAPTRNDIRSIFAGLRPLIHPDHSDGQNTAALSREHTVLTSKSGLITVTGGKWTTYRLMAEHVINRAAEVASLPNVACSTRQLKLHGNTDQPVNNVYGSDAPLLAALPGYEIKLHLNLPYSEAMVRYAIRYEAARSIEDILARRTRALFLDAAAATTCIERVAQIFQEELKIPTENLNEMIRKAHITSRRFSQLPF